MLRFPGAKINIGLFVTGKRDDGYHNIESIFYPVEFTDALEAVIASHDACKLHLSGRPIDGSLQNNLVVKAWQLLHQHHNIQGVDAYLIKKIPMGAGLGGGSSNGANMLLLLNDLFELNLSNDVLLKYAAQLGSDCPFFISNQPSFVSGRGELIESIDLSLSGKWLMVIHPGIHVSTPEAYGLISPYRADVSLKEMVSLPPMDWGSMAINHFEKPVSEKYPVIKDVRRMLEEAGSIFTSMSGSGSAVYGIFETPPKLGDLPESWTVNQCVLK